MHLYEATVSPTSLNYFKPFKDPFKGHLLPMLLNLHQQSCQQHSSKLHKNIDPQVADAETFFGGGVGGIH